MRKKCALQSKVSIINCTVRFDLYHYLDIEKKCTNRYPTSFLYSSHYNIRTVSSWHLLPTLPNWLKTIYGHLGSATNSLCLVSAQEGIVCTKDKLYLICKINRARTSPEFMIYLALYNSPAVSPPLVSGWHLSQKHKSTLVIYQKDIHFRLYKFYRYLTHAEIA